MEYPPIGTPMMRWDVINFLISKYRYSRYLEIGVAAGETFDKVKCAIKHSVDPNDVVPPTFKMTSDQFFASRTSGVDPLGAYSYDIIFIDGLHERAQVIKDVDNSLAALSETGTIVVHDCLPEVEGQQIMPYPNLGWWTGDVWKAIVDLRTRTDLSVYVVDVDWGCGIIRRGNQPPIQLPQELSWKYYTEHKKELLSPVSVTQFFEREFNG